MNIDIPVLPLPEGQPTSFLTSATTTRKRQRTASSYIKPVCPYKRADNVTDSYTLATLQEKYKYEIEKLGWIILTTNTNTINSYKIDLANLYQTLTLRKRAQNVANNYYGSPIDDITIMSTHIKQISEFVNSHFKTGFSV
jgi:hypothetical protein